jgi:hypothetical protein
MANYVVNSGITAPVSYSTYANTAVGGLYTAGTNWSTTAITQSSAKVQITDSDIIMDGVSLRDTMAKLQDRLAILQPKPEHLEQFEALKQAYDHYKTLEALCCPSKPADK